MRQWTGTRDDVTDIDGEGLAVANNISLNTTGELRRRPGLSDRIAQSGILVAEFQQQGGASYAIFFTSTGTIESVAL